MRSADDRWDVDAKKKYEGLVVKLGAQWLRLINPVVFGAQAKSYRSLPGAKKETELCMSTNKCPDHRLSTRVSRNFSVGGPKEIRMSISTVQERCY